METFNLALSLIGCAFFCVLGYKMGKQEPLRLRKPKGIVAHVEKPVEKWNKETKQFEPVFKPQETTFSLDPKLIDTSKFR